MTVQDAIFALRRFNIWRRYDGPAGCAPKMPDMKEIGQAIDVLCDYAERRIKTPQHFTLEELLKSQTALDKKIPNLPSWEVVENLRETAFDLDQIREDVGVAISASSGFRCEELNKAVDGSPTSVHRNGDAVDFQCPTMTFGNFKEKVVNSIKRRGLKFDQLIIESEKKSGKKWLHYGRRNNAGQQRMQIKVMEK